MVPTLSAYCVLSLAAFLGGITKGITGFGNAIINLLVWVMFTAIGVESGSLQQSVLCDCVASLVYSIPLLFMTAAHKTADWRLVVTLLCFLSAGAPLGVEMLTKLNSRWVELVMAIVLLLVICVHVKLHSKLAEAIHKWQARNGCAPDGGLEDKGASCVSNAHRHFLDVPAESTSAAGEAAQMQLPHTETTSEARSSAEASRSASSTPSCQPIKNFCALADLAVPALASARSGNDDLRNSSATDRDQAQSAQGNACCSSAHEPVTSVICIVADTRAVNVPDACFLGAGRSSQAGDTGCKQPASLHDGAEDQRPLLAQDDGTPCQNSAFFEQRDPESGRGSTAGAGCGQEPGGSWRGGDGVRGWLGRQDWREIRRMLLYGSVAGFASGVMGGMTGIGGPPIMYMYEKLHIKADVVRGTGAVTNVLQVRVITYLVMGVFKREDLPLFAAASATGFAGVVIGNCLKGRLDQRGFSRMLVALMVICCGLLFGAAAGLTGR